MCNMIDIRYLTPLTTMLLLHDFTLILSLPFNLMLGFLLYRINELTMTNHDIWSFPDQR